MNLRFALAGLCVMIGCWPARPAFAALPASPASYRTITPTLEGTTVVLTGKNLTLEQVVQVARFGARVELSPEARQRSADAYGLLLEAAAEGISVYWFNRGAGSGREKFIFRGDPLSPANKALLESRQLALFRGGAHMGLGPEVDAEEIVRAMMVVRANAMSYEAASPPLTQALLDLLNRRITPVVQSRGTVGEGDLWPLANVGAAMVGEGEVYYRGERMSAALALKRAGLAPLAPFAADDSALESSNAYATGQAALVLQDAREALCWAELAYVVDLNGMNSSISPLAQPVQANRPFPWLNWEAARVLEMLRGSYLFEHDDQRIIQDPVSLRASAIRQGSAWQAWARLRADVVLQMNSSDHNPAVRVGASPTDSWELSTPQLAQFYVKGGPRSHGQHGFILSNANWDPYPMANDLEAFSIALANMDAAIAQRPLRFTNTFFTVIAPRENAAGEAAAAGAPRADEYELTALMQEIQGLINPVPPEGIALENTVEDLETQTRLKTLRARTLVNDTIDLIAQDLLTGTYWLDQRKAQNPAREFGAATTSLWSAFRKALPAGGGESVAPGASATLPPMPPAQIAADFIRAHPAAEFHPRDAGGPPDAAEGPPPANHALR